MREYTVLLDPPVYTPGPASSAAVAAPVVGTATREGSISRAPAAAAAPATSAETSGEAPAPAPPARSRTPSAPSAQPGGTRLVQRGDTLSQIAGSLSSSGGAGTRSWMVAVYQANPSAFEGNMNLMHAGAVLRIPDPATAAAIAPSDALGEIRRQYASWRGAPPRTEAAGAQSGQLHLVTPEQSTQPGNQPSGTGTSAGVEARIHELEAQLQESRRLLEMRNAELAKLQAQIGAHGAAAPAAPSAPSTAAAPAPSAPPAAATPAPEVTQAPPPEAAAPPPAAQPAPAVVQPAPVVTTPGPSLLSRLLRYWWIAALIVVALLVRVGLSAWRSRQQVNFDDSLGRLASAGADSMNRDTLGDTANMRAARDPTFVVEEESAAHERPRAAPVAARPVKVEDTMSSETAINLDQGDPLAEADFHMAYGLYDQAADLVRIAISREPERRDLKLKLLEVFFVWGNKEQFLQSAHELAATRDQAPPGEWEKIVIMGKQLAPEDALFSGGAAVRGAAAGGVDLDLEGGESRIDFDLLGEPVPEEAAAGLDLDIGSAIGEKDSSSESQTTRATDANLALHGLDFGQDASAATTRQMTQRAEPIPSDGVEPTVEQPTLHRDDNPTIRQKVERALKHSGGGDQTAELALDDLGLDLGALDTVDQPNLASSPDAPTLVAGLDDTSRHAMEDADDRAREARADSGASGVWRAKPEDMDATLPPVALSEFDEKTAGEDTSGTSRLAALKGHDLDFDLGDMDSAPAANTGGEVDLDVGDAAASDRAFTITQKLSSDELALPDLEPATMSEVGTKLDLARAYMDMGDPEGARNILEEVLNEGSVAQKQEAQRLLQSLPG